LGGFELPSVLGIEGTEPVTELEEVTEVLARICKSWDFLAKKNQSSCEYI
jgi:hypothetical protein